MIVDANLLLFAVDGGSPFHRSAQAWLGQALHGNERVGLPLQSLSAVVRLLTNPRLFSRPLSAVQAADLVESWLASPTVWVPPTTEQTVRIFTGLVRRHHVSGNLVPDAQLAALAIENGVAVASADTDFARFSEVRWVNPLRG